MNKSISQMSQSVYDSGRTQKLNGNKANHQITTSQHNAIDLNYLNEKLKKIKDQTDNENFSCSQDPKSNVANYKKMFPNQKDFTFVRDSQKSPEKKLILRSRSNMDKHHANPGTFLEQEAKNRYFANPQQNSYGNPNQVPNEFFSRIKEFPNEKNRPSQLRQSLNLENAKQYALQQTRQISESLRSSLSRSGSETSQSRDHSYQSGSVKSLSAVSRSSSSLSLKDNEQNKPSPSKQIRRGASALGVINKSKVIVLRREKSIACQATTNHRSLKQSTKPKKPSKQNCQKVDSNGSDDHSLMKKKLLASLNLVASNNSRISRTSSTTSGVELSSSKNSTNDANSVRHEDSSDNIHRTDVKIIDKSIERFDEDEERLNIADSSIKKLKNRIFILEYELEAQEKKLNIEKEMKQKQIDQLKTRHETEKNAALTALEAKLNSEKLLELNKLKESIDFERGAETDQYQKKLDCDLLNLKLKMREKSDKCLKLERLLREEKAKNAQLFAKSMEIVKKYNQEVKEFREVRNSSSSSHASTAETQTDTKFLLNESCIEKLSHICQSLEAVSLSRTGDLPALSPSNRLSNPDADAYSLIKKVEFLTSELKTKWLSSREEVKFVHKQQEKLRDDLKACKDTKAKLESLYKIKCKSDLNKSAQIKKCQMNYEMELSKFRNESNLSLVAHLEAQLSVKDGLLVEQSHQLENICELLDSLNEANDMSSDTMNYIERVKESVKAVRFSRNLKTNLRDGGSNKNMLRVRTVNKVFTPEVLFFRIDDNE